MTTRPQKLRRIYLELRRVVGNTVPAHELLRLAAALVIEPTQSEDFGYGVNREQPRFEQLPLDRAFSDGGWRVLENERSWIKSVYADDDPKPRMDLVA